MGSLNKIDSSKGVILILIQAGIFTNIENVKDKERKKRIETYINYLY
jgi:hypothetical protein